MSTNIETAFEKAGLKSARKRLDEIVRDKVKFSRSFTQAVNDVLSLCRTDADLMWELCRNHRDQAAADLVRAAAKKKNWGSHNPFENRKSNASPAGRNLCGGETPTKSVPSGRNAESIAAAAVVVTKSLLDTFQVNGQPIGDLTAREVLASAETDARNARFKTMLCTGLPPKGKLRDYLKPADADRAWRLAGGDNGY